MKKLNITSEILDKMGFSEYWDEHGTWGTRTLYFSNGTRFQITEQEEMDDLFEGYSGLAGEKPIYISNHYYFSGSYANPKYDLFFLHEMYECIKKEYPQCLDEFINKCKTLNMMPYIDSYLNQIENK